MVIYVHCFWVSQSGSKEKPHTPKNHLLILRESANTDSAVEKFRLNPLAKSLCNPCSDTFTGDFDFQDPLRWAPRIGPLHWAVLGLWFS